MSTLSITIVQAELHWHDAAANRRAFGEILSGLGRDTQVIVLPEMFTTGFTMHAEDHAETMDGPTINWMAEQAGRADAAVCGSFIARDGDEFFNRFIFMEPDGSCSTYDKRHLFRLARKDRHYSPGRKRIVVPYRGVRLCLQVCYDLRFPVWSRNRGDYDALIYVANWPAPRHRAWHTLLRARAIENQAYVIGVNRTGTDGNGLPYLGSSAIVNYLGEDEADLGEAPGTATVEIDTEELNRFREKFAFHLDADDFELTA